MSAMWRASRGAVRRRRLQTFVVGVVVLVSTAAVTVALSLLSASSAPFDRVFEEQDGAHAVAFFEPGTVSDTQLAADPPPGVQSVAGPFEQALLEIPPDSGRVLGARALTVVGRGDPGGPVDRVDLWAGRWATGLGEIVLNSVPGAAARGGYLGTEIVVPGGPALTVVGHAYSASQTADAWVSPGQISALDPSTTQMLYRFTDPDTPAQVDAGMAEVTAGLPPDALLAEQSWLTVKEAVAAGPGAYVPFLVVFGLLGLVVAVLIIGNVVSGAVVSGFRHIGILKALGFTPRQVVLVYVVMVLVPATVGGALGVGLGYLGAQPVLEMAFRGLGFGGDVGVRWWVVLAVLVSIPAIVVVAALMPASRAYRLSAARAISAGSAPRAGSGARIQRWLSGTRLPRPVSLGLGLPFTRPGRTALTLAAVVLGVTTVTFASGLASTVTRYADATDINNATPVGMRPGNPDLDQVVTTMDPAQIEEVLRALPGTARLSVSAGVSVSVVGHPRTMSGSFMRGDADTGFSDMVVNGRWLRGLDEIVLPSAVLNQRGLRVGDRVTLQLANNQREVTIVGATLSGGIGGGDFFALWQTLDELAPGYQLAKSNYFYQLQPAPGTEVRELVRQVNAADPGFYAWDNQGTNSFTVTVVGFSTTLSVLLGIVAALGVFNTVVLTVNERRRDLGMLRSIGMKPAQVVGMMVASMTALGVVGGMIGAPLGVLAHRLIVPMTARAAQVDIAEFLLNVWQTRLLLLLALTGVLIAAIGALIPARSASRLPISRVLHNE